MAKKICKKCKEKNHTRCPLVSGCPCCDQVKKQLQEENFDTGIEKEFNSINSSLDE